jgi:hypothetical protein
MVEAFNKRPVPSVLPVITPSYLKTNFLFGVDLRDDDGNSMPDSLMEMYILSAQQWIEKELNILLQETTFINQRHDYYAADYYQYCFLKVNWRPLQSIEKLQAIWPVGSGSIEFNDEWIKADYISGQINLVPTSGTISAFLIGQNAAFLPLLSGRDYIPELFSIDYKAGFKAGEIPTDILECIGMKASLGPLNIAGDLIAGAGIASKSVSLDGISQSIGTTSSATNAGYGARIIQYEKQLKERMAILKGYWNGIQMGVA